MMKSSAALMQRVKLWLLLPWKIPNDTGNPNNEKCEVDIDTMFPQGRGMAGRQGILMHHVAACSSMAAGKLRASGLQWVVGRDCLPLHHASASVCFQCHCMSLLWAVRLDHLCVPLPLPVVAAGHCQPPCAHTSCTGHAHPSLFLG